MKCVNLYNSCLPICLILCDSHWETCWYCYGDIVFILEEEPMIEWCFEVSA